MTLIIMTFSCLEYHWIIEKWKLMKCQLSQGNEFLIFHYYTLREEVLCRVSTNARFKWDWFLVPHHFFSHTVFLQGRKDLWCTLRWLVPICPWGIPSKMNCFSTVSCYDILFLLDQPPIFQIQSISRKQEDQRTTRPFGVFFKQCNPTVLESIL